MSFLYQSRVPGFIDADPIIQKQEFASIEVLLEHPRIKSWNKGDKDFHFCWSISNGEWSKACLMAEWTNSKGKREWYVLGYLSEIPESLPKWVSPTDEEAEEINPGNNEPEYD